MRKYILFILLFSSLAGFAQTKDFPFPAQFRSTVKVDSTIQLQVGTTANEISTDSTLADESETTLVSEARLRSMRIRLIYGKLTLTVLITKQGQT